MAYQLQATKTRLIITHAEFLDTTLSAAQTARIPADRIVVIEGATGSRSHVTLNELIASGLKAESSFIERKLTPGEAKTKIAFLSFSSGTTGRPKVLRFVCP